MLIVNNHNFLILNVQKNKFTQFNRFYNYFVEDQTIPKHLSLISVIDNGTGGGGRLQFIM